MIGGHSSLGVDLGSRGDRSAGVPTAYLRIRSKLGESLRFRLAEWGLSAIMLSWGLVVRQRSEDFGATAYTAELMRSLPLEVWGWLAIALALIRLGVLIVNGSWRRCSHARGALAFLSCFFWLQISLGFFIGGNVSTGIAVYPWFLAMDAYTVFRAMRDAREADDKRRAVAVLAVEALPRALADPSGAKHNGGA